jgi:hypothetical protein
MDNVRSGSRNDYGWLDRVHRAGAVLFGLGLWAFGILGLVNRLEPFSTTGREILGLSSNGLLSVISLVVGGVLIAAGLKGGRVASTVTVVVGAAFVLSGVLNVLVLETPLNLLAFGMSNVVFSLVAGALLLFLGGYGRFAGRLPDDNPYRKDRGAVDGARDREPDPLYLTDPGNAAAARELAAAERAAALHTATREQSERLARIRGLRKAEERVQAWRVLPR